LQKQDGLMVWQKMGARDKLAYYVTLGIMGVGFYYSLSTIWKLCWPKPVVKAE
jgi:hypothetical protein